MPPVSETHEERPVEQRAYVVSVNFDQQTVTDLQKLTRKQRLEPFVHDALLFYATLLELAEKGFTEIVARNPKTGEHMTYNQPLLNDE